MPRARDAVPNASPAAAVACVVLDGSLELELDHERDLEPDGLDELQAHDLAAVAALGCTVNVGAPFAPTGTGRVYSTSSVGGCSELTHVEVVMRIDRSWWPDKTIAYTKVGVGPYEWRAFELSAACSVAYAKRVFTEVRISNRLGSAKYQSTRTYVLCS